MTDPMDLLEQLFPARRYVALTEEQASELGREAYNEWRVASKCGVHISSLDFVDLLTDANRWRRTRKAVVNIGAGLFFGAVFVGLMVVLSVILARVP